MQKQLEQSDEQIAQLSAKLESTQTELEAQHNNLQANRAREDEASAKQTTELQKRVAELESQSEQFSREREKFEQDHQELQQQLSELQQQHTTLQQAAATTTDETLASQDTATADEPQTPIERELRRRVERNRVEQPETTPSEQEQAVTETTAQSTPPEQSSTDEDALFARLRALSVLKQDSAETAEEELAKTAEPQDTDEVSTAAEQETLEADQSTEATDQPPQEEVEQSVAEPPAVAALAVTPEQHHPEDNSIDDYMAKLLQRMRGISATEPPPARQPTATARTKEPMPVAVESTGENTEASSPDDVENPLKPAKFEPRSPAPEKTHNLAAMREIANLSASVCNCLPPSSQWIKSSLDHGVRRWVLPGAGNSIALPDAGICFDDHLVWLGWVDCGDIFHGAIEIAAAEFEIVEAP